MTPGPKEAYSKTDAPMVMKLKRSLYGLAQSSFPWYGTIDATLLGISFTPTASRPHAYTCWRRRHVGDPHPPRGRNLTQGSHPFEEGACGPLCHDCHGRRKSIVFGISVARDYDKRTLTISQEDCVQNAPQEWFWYNRVQHSQLIWIQGQTVQRAAVGRTVGREAHQALPSNRGAATLPRTGYTLRQSALQSTNPQGYAANSQRLM